MSHERISLLNHKRETVITSKLTDARRRRTTAEAHLDQARREAEVATEQLHEWTADEPCADLARRGEAELRRRERQLRAASDRVSAAIEHAAAEKERAAEDHQRAAEEQREAAEEQRLCVVCCDRPKTHAPTSCLHLCCCEGCAAGLAECPICRAAVPPPPLGGWRQVFT